MRKNQDVLREFSNDTLDYLTPCEELFHPISGYLMFLIDYFLKKKIDTITGFAKPSRSCCIKFWINNF